MPDDERTDEPDSVPPGGTSTDEQLVQLFYGGDKTALDAILKRYDGHILSYLGSFSRYRWDKNYLLDVRIRAEETLYNELKERGYEPITGVPFQKWVYKIVCNACMNEDKKRRKSLEKDETVVMPDEGQKIDDELFVLSMPEATDYEEQDNRIDRALPRLSKLERKLIKLKTQKKPLKFREIAELPEFRKYSIDYLRLKFYNIHQRMIKGETGEEEDHD